jgi:hypothetical protein
LYSVDSLNLTVYEWKLPHTEDDNTLPKITIQQIHPEFKRFLPKPFWGPLLSLHTKAGEEARHLLHVHLVSRQASPQQVAFLLAFLVGIDNLEHLCYDSCAARDGRCKSLPLFLYLKN